MEKSWKIVLILFALIVAFAILLFLLVKFDVIKNKSGDQTCISQDICYFSSTNIPCNFNYDCDSKQLLSLHASCDLSTGKCVEFTDRRITSKEECLEKEGKWGSEGNCE
jgi:hypothetical protein